MKMAKEFNVEVLLLGDKIQGDRIVFKSMDELHRAYKEIDNGNDIYVVVDGVITLLPHRMLNTKIYEGSIALSARKCEVKE